MGTPAAAVPSLKRLLADGHDIKAAYTQPDRPAGRGRQIVRSPVKELALLEGIPVKQPESFRTIEEIVRFRDLDADCAVVVAYGRILPKEMLEAYPHGAINVHFSLLPKYRGAAPVNWAIVNGEAVTGVTIMQMDTGLDTGDILLQEELLIGEREAAPELLDRAANLGADMLSRALSNISDLIPIKQNDDEATYAPILKRSDGEIDWRMKAEQIERRIRGFKPFPGSFTWFKGKRVVLHDAEAIEADVAVMTAGTIASVPDDGIVVRCGEGSCLKIYELQPEGKKRQSAADFANGFRVEAGKRFG